MKNQYNGRGVITREFSEGSITDNDQFIFYFLTNEFNSHDYSDRLLEAELPGGEFLYYQDLSGRDDVPYCFFVKTRKQKRDKLEDVFKHASKAVHDFPLEEGVELEEDCAENLSSVIDSYFDKSLNTKITFAGYAGVGKTTINHLLRGETLPMIHDPTLGYQVKPSKVNGVLGNIYVWDTGGQTQYLPFLKKYARGSDLVALVTDSKLETVLKSKKNILPIIREYAPEAELVSVANKQDLPKALTPERIGQILGLPALGLNALDFDNRERIIEFLSEHLV